VEAGTKVQPPLKSVFTLSCEKYKWSPIQLYSTVNSVQSDEDV